MSARLLDGNAVAAAIREAVLPGRPARSPREPGRPPGLGIVLVGEDPSSEIYVRNKVQGRQRDRPVGRPAAPACDGQPRRAAGAGRAPERQRRRTTGSWSSRRCRRRWGSTPRKRVFDAIDPAQGRRRIQSGQRRPARPGPSAPGAVHAVRRDRDARSLAASRSRGSRAVVIGRSEIVGKPMAMLLLQRDATVTICHSKTPDLPAVAREADILVAAIGPRRLRHAGVREARRDGHRRRHQPRHRSRRSRGRFSTRARSGSQTSSAGDRSSSATCTRRSPRWPAR